jgi:alkylation response protein AidB-like acyl-CoA dehydrogenase
VKQKTWHDETDAALHDAALRYTAERYAFDVRQRMTPTERRFDARVWADMAEMGWLAVATPEEEGGLGVRIASICLLAEAAGRALVTEPLTSSGVLAPHLVANHGSPAQRAELLPRLHAGELRLACLLNANGVTVRDGFLRGTQPVLLDGDIARHLIVHAGEALWLVDATAAGVDRRAFPLLDGRGAATVRFDDVQAVRLGDCDAAALAPALHLAALATAADSLGAMSAAFDLTLEYLKTRRQFGVPLGTHQALQHRAVDMYVALSESRAVLDLAIETAQAGSPEAARNVHAAKSFVCESARRVTQEAVQLHGGIGITEEYAVSHWLRRARVNEQLWGSAEQHFLAFAASTAQADGHTA